MGIVLGTLEKQKKTGTTISSPFVPFCAIVNVPYIMMTYEENGHMMMMTLLRHNMAYMAYYVGPLSDPGTQHDLHEHNTTSIRSHFKSL